MVSELRVGRRKGRALAVAASGAAHALVVSLLVWRLGTAPPLADPPVMSVELATLPHRAPRETVREPPRTQRPSRTAQPPALHVTPEPPPAESREANPAPETPGGRGAGVTQALRGLLGCEHADLMKLSPEERERCRDRQTADAAGLRGQPPGRLNLDRHGDYAANPEPYINRKPTNGCKPRAAGDVRRDGAQGVRAAVSCAVPF
jgi:hypothetical protein